MRQLVVVIGGGELSELAIDHVAPDALVIAADGGLDHAVAAGLAPGLLVGDLDSITASGTMWAYAHEIEIRRHPADKDATDTELALDTAVESLDSEGGHLLLLGGDGDRLDHTMASLVALGRPPMAAFASIDFMLGETSGHVLHPGASCMLTHPPVATFSLLALHGECTGVDVVGARWPLTDATLVPGETRGVSNEIAGPSHIRTRTGVLTVIVP